MVNWGCVARKALVAEFLPISKPVDAADQQAFPIKLNRDAQIKLTAQRLVVGHKRLRRRAAGNRCIMGSRLTQPRR